MNSGFLLPPSFLFLQTYPSSYCGLPLGAPPPTILLLPGNSASWWIPSLALSFSSSPSPFLCVSHQYTPTFSTRIPQAAAVNKNSKELSRTQQLLQLSRIQRLATATQDWTIHPTKENMR